MDARDAGRARGGARDAHRTAAAWRPPHDWRRLITIDAHAEGEPLRVFVGGFPELRGASMLERRREARARHDAIRTALMWEPRGHADMYGCWVTPAVTDGADFGVLFTHNEGYSTMCGHGIIAVVTVLVEIGCVEAVAPETVVRIDTPAGLVTAFARVDGSRVRSVRFQNVPSFVLARDRHVDVPALGRVRYDVAFGGAFYAFVDAGPLGLRLDATGYRGLIDAGRAVKRAVAAELDVAHPFDDDLSFLYGTIFVGAAEHEGVHSRNVCVFADGEVDRSPTGTGVSARLAIHHARGELEVGERITVESLLGTRFSGRVLRATQFGPHAAVVPEVEGRAWITGRHEFVIAPDDPLAEGFLLR